MGRFGDYLRIDRRTIYLSLLTKPPAAYKSAAGELTILPGNISGRIVLMPFNKFITYPGSSGYIYLYIPYWPDKLIQLSLRLAITVSVSVFASPIDAVITSFTIESIK